MRGLGVRTRPLLIIALLGLLSACPTSQEPPEPDPDPEVCDDEADNDGDGAIDCDDSDCADEAACEPVNQPPTPPTVTITPAAPRTADDLHCAWETDAVDPEGHAISYAQRWRLDGQPDDHEGPDVPSALTSKAQVWTCVVEVTDELGAAAEGTASVAIGNTPPGAIQVRIEPTAPTTGDMLICMPESLPVDPDDDQVFIDFTWLRDDVAVDVPFDFIPSPMTWGGEQWACHAFATDGFDAGPESQASVTVQGSIEPHVAAGSDHSCALGPDGAISCWGSDALGQLAVPDGLYERVVAGAGVGCALRLEDGTLACWGDDQAGLTSPADLDYADVALGASHGCGLTRGLDLVGWGDAADWDDPPGGLLVQVTAGDGWCCALEENGQAVCWGAPPFPAPTGEWRKLDAGDGFMCALGWGGEVLCWGDDSHGQVGGAPAGSFSDVSAGLRHACAVQDGSGLVTCWGDDGAGQSTPPGDSFGRLSAGDHHTCGLRSDGQVACWGCGGEDPGPCEPPLLP